MQKNYYVIDGIKMKAALVAGFKNLTKYKNHINSLNVFPVPDGDTGTNMHLTLANAVKEAEKVEDDIDSVGAIVKAISKGALMGARGNSGVILSQLFRGFSQELENKDKIDHKDLARAFDNAVILAYKAVLKPVEGTILTVAKAISKGVHEASDSHDDISVLLKHGLDAGEDALAKTPELLPVLAQAGVVDAGGKGLLAILHGVSLYLDGKEIAGLEDEEEHEKISQEKTYKDDDIGEFQYCTECVIQGKNLKEQEIRDEIKVLGDSVLVVGSDDVIKVHVHTNNPGKVLEIGVKYGSLHDLKIENMADQNVDFVANKANKLSNKSDNSTGIVAVVAGEGLKEIMYSMGVDMVIDGGQTMNPSTKTILEAVDELNTETVIVLPNNKNIILAAEQAAKLAKKKVIVIPTKSFPQGMAAMLGYDVNEDLKTNAKNMSEHFVDVSTGEITYAVRDTEYNGLKISQDDIIAILDGEIVYSGAEIEEVMTELLDKISKDNVELITVFYGGTVKETEAEAIKGKFNEKYPDLEFELYWGGQPLYHYIISVE